MPDIIHTYDKKNDTHVLSDVDVDHYGPVFLVPPKMILGGRPGGGDPWENIETTARDCGGRQWTTVYDDHFGVPIGRRLDVSVYGGPIGDAYEGHISGSIRLWYQPLSEASLSELRQLSKTLPAAES
jgi:hypothetical protein